MGKILIQKITLGGLESLMELKSGLPEPAGEFVRRVTNWALDPTAAADAATGSAGIAVTPSKIQVLVS